MSYFYLELGVTVTHTPNANSYLMFNWDGEGESIQLFLINVRFSNHTPIYFLEA